jgi:hypothetical protein
VSGDIYCWLVELPPAGKRPSAMWLDRWSVFTTDPFEAVRFSTRELAEERIRDMDGLLGTDLVATDHLFVHHRADR